MDYIKNCEIAKFIKKHKISVGLFVLSLGVLLKNSDIPYFVMTPSLVVKFFNRPVGIWESVADLVDMFASAYATSFLFYIIVDYFPQRRQAQKAEIIIRPKLVRLYSNIQYLIAMLEFLSRQQDLKQEESENDMDMLCITDCIIICNVTRCRNNIPEEKILQKLNPLKSLDSYRNEILENCKTIANILSFTYCEKEIINLISEIQLSNLLTAIIPRKENILLKNLNISMQYPGLEKGYKQIKNICEELGGFVSEKTTYYIEMASEEESIRYTKNSINRKDELEKMLEGSNIMVKSLYH